MKQETREVECGGGGGGGGGYCIVIHVLGVSMNILKIIEIQQIIE